MVGRSGRTFVGHEPHEPETERVQGCLVWPFCGRVPLPEPRADPALEKVRKTCALELDLIPSVILGHHDKGDLEVVEEGGGVDVALTYATKGIAVNGELGGEVGSSEGARSVAPAIRMYVEVVAPEGSVYVEHALEYAGVERGVGGIAEEVVDGAAGSKEGGEGVWVAVWVEEDEGEGDVFEELLGECAEGHG